MGESGVSVPTAHSCSSPPCQRCPLHLAPCYNKITTKTAASQRKVPGLDCVDHHVPCAELFVITSKLVEGWAKMKHRDV